MTFGYWLFILMIIPVIAGCVSWIKFSTISLKESGVSVAAALVIISLVFGVSKFNSGIDTETYSGKVTKATHIPKWEAEWTELVTHTTTDSKGNVSTYTTLETRHQTHYPKWYVETTLGRISISENFFKQIGNRHGIVAERGYRPDYDSGDKNDYHSYVNDDPEFCDYPVTTCENWFNPLKNAKSLHSFKGMSKEEADKLGLYDYPVNDTFTSSRLIGNHAITIWNWDKMNSALGSQKHVNLILVKLPSVDKAKHLQNYWKNGKKNDLVICYNGKIGEPANWCYVFGWSKSELVKMNLQTLFLDKPVTNDILPDIKRIVRKDFAPHDWTMYKDADQVIPTGYVITAFLLMLGIQVALYYQFHKIDI